MTDKDPNENIYSASLKNAMELEERQIRSIINQVKSDAREEEKHDQINTDDVNDSYVTFKRA